MLAASAQNRPSSGMFTGTLGDFIVEMNGFPINAELSNYTDFISIINQFISNRVSNQVWNKQLGAQKLYI